MDWGSQCFQFLILDAVAISRPLKQMSQSMSQSRLGERCHEEHDTQQQFLSAARRNVWECGHRSIGWWTCINMYQHVTRRQRVQNDPQTGRQHVLEWWSREGLWIPGFNTSHEGHHFSGTRRAPQFGLSFRSERCRPAKKGRPAKRAAVTMWRWAGGTEPKNGWNALVLCSKSHPTLGEKDGGIAECCCPDVQRHV